MNEKSYRVLEYNKILSLLSGEAASSMTQSVIEGLRPSLHEEEIKDMLAETTEAVTVIMRKGAPPLGGFGDIKEHLLLADKGSTLTMKQLLEILHQLQIVRAVSNFLHSDLPALPIIDSLSELLSTQRRLEDDIQRCILSEDEMSDQASTALRDIRRGIQRQNESIRSKLNQILNSSDHRTILQDALVTMRQDRYVIPVKQEHRGKFPGIVHDQSATGATLFIEPQAIVNMNNELRQLELEEKIEIERILAELSAAVAEVHLFLLNNQDLLLKLDFLFAKGRLSVKMKACAPNLNTRGILRIRNGRHPLIPADKVVPISIVLGDQYETLVVTGPNTGGKTVTLKTVGLFALMAQSGLHLPAEDGTEMPMLKKIFADIGDEQSIEQSLSTFSSHMNNIVDILKNCGKGTLVLLDELGAGTDPTEGAALAISILEYLSQVGTKTIATTHYTELKKYALSTTGVENASMEFNVETLTPTYRLQIGTPGRSNAFEISQKLGLRTDIIEKARGLLQRGDIQFEEVITSIEEDKKAAEEERDEAIFLRLEMQKQKERLEEDKRRFAEQKEKILSRARDEARDMVAEAKALTEQVQKELRELEKVQDSSDRNRKFEDVRQKVRTANGRYREKIEVEENPNPLRREELKLGDRVRVLSLDQKGNIISLPDDREEVQVQVGLLKVNVKLSNLSKIQDGSKPKKAKQKSRYGSLYGSKVQSVSISVNVRGMMLDDALMEVDKYLDDAYIAGLPEVTIIHGRGEGILREGIHQMFRSHKHVAKFRKGAYNEGGDGVTVVTLKG